jgi:UDP-N-acetyl-D-glucosamine dehydrogenase
MAPQYDFDVALIGLGYVGLPTALAFHGSGARVLGIDINAAHLARIRARNVDLLASDQARLRRALTSERLALSDDTAAAAQAAAVIICVPTPVTAYLVPDLTPLHRACEAVVEHAMPGQVIILTSTTYVGSTQDMLVKPLAARGLRVGREISVAFSPERIDPGNDAHAHEDVPRVVGGATQQCTAAAMKVLSRCMVNLHSVSSDGAAEMTKLLENTFRAVNIALANEIAEASRALNIDVMEVIGAAATKPYGFMPFFPGPGAGGHCIPCDPHYLLWQLRRERLQTPVVAEAMSAIAGRPRRVVERVREVLSDAGMGLPGARVLVLGVAYKAGVEDLRESPALEIMEGLRAGRAEVMYHDPYVSSVALSDGHVLTSVAPESAESDLVLVHTLHQGVDLTWLNEDQLILDATYRLAGAPRRVTL